MHLILSLSVSYTSFFLIHDFADNSQEGMKHHHTRGGTQAQQGMTLQITLLCFKVWGCKLLC
jgi:hypothetical protein